MHILKLLVSTPSENCVFGQFYPGHNKMKQTRGYQVKVKDNSVRYLIKKIGVQISNLVFYTQSTVKVTSGRRLVRIMTKKMGTIRPYFTGWLQTGILITQRPVGATSTSPDGNSSHLSHPKAQHVRVLLFFCDLATSWHADPKSNAMKGMRHKMRGLSSNARICFISEFFCCWGWGFVVCLFLFFQ